MSGGGGVHIQRCVIAKFVEKRQRNSERVNHGTPGLIRNGEMMNATQMKRGQFKIEYMTKMELGNGIQLTCEIKCIACEKWKMQMGNGR